MVTMSIIMSDHDCDGNDNDDGNSNCHDNCNKETITET